MSCKFILLFPVLGGRRESVAGRSAEPRGPLVLPVHHGPFVSTQRGRSQALRRYLPCARDDGMLWRVSSFGGGTGVPGNECDADARLIRVSPKPSGRSPSHATLALALALPNVRVGRARRTTRMFLQQSYGGGELGQGKLSPMLGCGSAVRRREADPTDAHRFQ